jgi:hypothetical protein
MEKIENYGQKSSYLVQNLEKNSIFSVRNNIENKAIHSFITGGLMNNIR